MHPQFLRMAGALHLPLEQTISTWSRSGWTGRVPRTLLATSRSEYSPAWSPSGGQYAYVTNANLASEIWLRSSQEGSARPLVRLDSGFPPWTELRRLQFSPDGRRIAYDIFGSKHVIAVSSIAGGEPVVLDQESTEQHSSSWSPDGNWIAYQRLNRAKAKYELVKTPLGGGKPVPICETSRSADERTGRPPESGSATTGAIELRLASVNGKTHKVLDSPRTAAVGFSRDGATLYAVRRNAAQKWELAALGVPDGREKKITPLDLPLSVTIDGSASIPTARASLLRWARPVTIYGCSTVSPNLAAGVFSVERPRHWFAGPKSGDRRAANHQLDFRIPSTPGREMPASEFFVALIIIMNRIVTSPA